jgi:hypothetical protein
LTVTPSILRLAAACLAAIPFGGRAAAPFEDRGAASGVDFVLENAATGEKHQIETMVGGVAIFDYDNDGRPDLYFVNGAAQPSLEKESPKFYNRLYRNLGHWKFEDVTEKAGVAGAGYQMGAAAADYDNDGWTDLFVVGVNRNILYRNRGDGTFEDVTAAAGLSGGSAKPWSIAAGWFDYDNDGHLDLFVVNYVVWDPATEPFCGDRQAGYRTYCHPKYYNGLPNQLFRNRGDGTFEDVTERAGIGRHIGKGMGVAFADVDGDGFLDVFVTNDTEADFLFLNGGDGTFREAGIQAGVAFNDDGRALSSMGVDFRDVDNDGRPDIFVTALANETFPLFRNLGKGLFADVTYPSGVGKATLAFSGWSNGIFDFDNDGHKDLFAANGDVQDNTEVYSSRKSRLPNLLLVNDGRGKFRAVSVGEAALHRGAAFADLDGDGRIDAVVTRIGERPLLLRNEMGAGRHWIGFKLRGHRSNRDGIGARVEIETPEGRRQWNHATTSVGYSSSSSAVVHFGLGSAARVAWVRIRWPSGQEQTLRDVEADRYLRVEEPGAASRE